MERRAHRRFGVADHICITVLPRTGDGSASDTYYAKSDDLSASGLKFTADAAFQTGQLLDLLVVRGCAFWGFSFQARVAWVRQVDDQKRWQVGVQFVDVPEPTRLAWTELIERAWEQTAPAGPNPGEKPNPDRAGGG